MTKRDRLKSDIFTALLCQFHARILEICKIHDINPAVSLEQFEQLNARFENLLQVTQTERIIPPEARPLTRMIAREFNIYSLSD